MYDIIKVSIVYVKFKVKLNGTLGLILPSITAELGRTNLTRSFIYFRAVFYILLPPVLTKCCLHDRLSLEVTSNFQNGIKQ